MEKVQSYRELAVWQKSMDLVGDVYRISRLLPKDERFALSDQLRRAVVSIPSNIVLEEYSLFLFCLKNK